MTTTSPPIEPPLPPVDDTVDPRSLLVQRAAVLAVTLLPALGLAAAVVLAWGDGLHWWDVVAFLVMYVLVGLGTSAGLHRLFSHASFVATRPLRAVLAVLGSMALMGPVAVWVAVHRRHHAHSDAEGDPHSPHAHDEHGSVRGLLRGLVHAHIGWMFTGQRFELDRWARDIRSDPMLVRIDRLYVVWGLLGLVLPALLAWALSGGRTDALLTGMLWGGAVRLFVLNHVTYSVNSLCHVFGRRPYETGDHSGNSWLLALPSFGDSWHNNHHAFPGSARHGLRWWQVDPSAIVIAGLVKVRLASHMNVPSEQALVRKRRRD